MRGFRANGRGARRCVGVGVSSIVVVVVERTAKAKAACTPVTMEVEGQAAREPNEHDSRAHGLV